MRIKELRIQNNISQKDLAETIGVAPNTLSQYETGKREPDNSTLIKLAQYFGVTVDYLLKNETPSEVPPNFPARLKYLREQKGETQEQLAEAMGYNLEDIDAWENGTLEADFKTKVQLASHFNSTMDFLTGNDPNKNIVVALHGGGRIVTEKKQPLSPKAVEVVKELADNVGKMDDTQLDALMAMIKAMKDR